MNSHYIEENGGSMDIYGGIDWAEDHHDIALVNRDGQLLARRRISDGAAGLAPVLARAQQDAVWDRTQAHNRLRSHLREYFPGFLAAFASAKGGIMRPEARTILAAAPTPADAAKLTLTQLRGLLKRAGRSRSLDAEATRLRDAFRVPQMRQLPLVEQAMGRQ